MANDIDYLRSPLELLLQKADTVLVVSELEQYLGFAAKETTSKAHASWAICKVIQSATTYPHTIDILWANGQRQKNLVFDDYATYNYTYPKF